MVKRCMLCWLSKYFIQVIEGIQSLLGQVAVKRTEMETGRKSEIKKMEPIEENLKKELTDILSKVL